MNIQNKEIESLNIKSSFYFTFDCAVGNEISPSTNHIIFMTFSDDKTLRYLSSMISIATMHLNFCVYTIYEYDNAT